jgi:hypothetical protein
MSEYYKTLKTKIGDLYMSFRQKFLSGFSGDKIVEYNDIEAVHVDYVWTDQFFDHRPKSIPRYFDEYEDELIKSIEEHIKPEHNVVIIGGGAGITTVKCADVVEGNVTVFEGSENLVEMIGKTVEYHCLEDTVDIQHSIVGTPEKLFGNGNFSEQVEPSELPDCDFLELDCEGSEYEILENMDIRPQYIVVETHGVHDAPTSDTIELLEDIGYTIVSQRTMNEDKDIKVISAKLMEF